MTARVLAEAVLALAPVGTVLGEVTSLTLPWTSLRVRVPGVSGRSDASTPQGHTVRVQATVAAANDVAALAVAQKVVDAFEGAVPVAAGWSTGPLLMVGDPSLYSDDVIVTTTNLHVQVAVLSFVFTASRNP